MPSALLDHCSHQALFSCPSTMSQSIGASIKSLQKLGIPKNMPFVAHFYDTAASWWDEALIMSSIKTFLLCVGTLSHTKQCRNVPWATHLPVPLVTQSLCVTMNSDIVPLQSISLWITEVLFNMVTCEWCHHPDRTSLSKYDPSLFSAAQIRRHFFPQRGGYISVFLSGEQSAHQGHNYLELRRERLGRWVSAATNSPINYLIGAFVFTMIYYLTKLFCNCQSNVCHFWNFRMLSVKCWEG